MAGREQALPQVGVLPEFAQRIGRPINTISTFARRKPIGFVAGVFMVAILALAIAAPVVATHDPIATDTPIKLQAPSANNFFGTDEMGRDVFSRLVWGARTSLVISYAAITISVLLATAIALPSAYYGGRVDLIVQRFVDAFQAIPGLLIVLTIVSILDPTILNLTLILGILFGIRETRVIRAAVLGIKVMPYVEAARSIGARTFRIMLRHLLPNVVYVILIIGSINIGRIIILEATLGFLGFGVPPPNPTWGQMLSGSARRFMTEAPWMGLAPGIAISFTVLAFNLLGDALRDVLDPRLRGSEQRR